MSRDLDPPVRERDAAPPPARRGSRREQAPVEPYDDADPYPPTGSRVMRDEHRPRRGTLPDRRMLRRDTPIDYSAEFADNAAQSGADGGEVRRADSGAWDNAALGARQDDPVPVAELAAGQGHGQPESHSTSGQAALDRAESVIPTPGLGDRAGEPGTSADHGRFEPSGVRVEAGGPDPVESRAATATRGTQEVSGTVEPTGRDDIVGERSGTSPKRRLPALPALEPGAENTDSSAALGDSRASAPSAGGAVSRGRELAVRGATDPGAAVRDGAGSGDVAAERGRARGPERTEGDRMDRKRTRDVEPGGDTARRAETGERSRRERPADDDPRRTRRGVESGDGRDRRSTETDSARGRRDGEAHTGRERRGLDGERGRERRRTDGDPGRDRRGADGHRGADGDPGRDRRSADGHRGADGHRRGEGDLPRERRGTGERDARRGDGERDARRGSGSEGRGRATDPDRVHLGGRTGTPGRARSARPEGESAERPARTRPTRNGRPERSTAEERGRGGLRKDKRDKDLDQAEREAAAKRAAARKAAAKKKQSGPKLLDDAQRAKLEVTAREGNGIKAAWATFRLHTDDLRRRNFAARAERIEYGNYDEFDRTTAQLTDRGYIGAGGGRMNVIGRPVEYRATTAQVAGLWPWSVGAGAPLIGTPLGSHLHTGAPVCFDPMNWFMRGSFITAPSLFVLGLNGFGKSSLVRRIVLGGVAQGITPLVLADVKPDYRKLVELVGGQVIDLGYGHGKLNPLAAGVLGSIVPMLHESPELQTQVMQEMRARQVSLVAGLVELVRGERVRDFEETLISTSLRILYREGSGFTPENPPIMEDLLDVVVAGGDELRLDAGADDEEEYAEAIKELRRSLRALTQGPFGAIFNGRTTTPIDTTATAVCIDVSHIPTGDKKLKAAVMLACWADGFASVEAAHVLADADLGPQRYFQVVMDELWQVLGLGDFMVDRVDELTRLQRGIATSLIMISHTIKDLQALGSEAAIAKALGFLERARAKIFGALPAEEIARLDSTVPFTSAEEDMVTSWSAPQALTGEALKPGQQRPPAPGTGKFLLKIGEDRRPGIPFHMEFTISERESGIHDTNQRFSEFTETTATRGAGTDSGSDEGSAA
ncbi:hypothetical protein ACQP06_14775 [Nocardia sp. CA-136227]|uniref:hypothetical protein n=1 Tax=Nocardia sp. CA-136227 TaxID=3239979 RepID=UPI003D97F842